MKVLIIGSSISGLSLACGLQKAGISFEVFDRKLSARTGPLDYGVHLNPQGCRTLRECLSRQSWKRFDATAGRIERFTRFYDQGFRLLATNTDQRLKGNVSVSSDCERSMNRADFQEVLLDDLAKSTLHWGKEFDGYQQTPDGRLRTYFADGTYAEGDVLVGADGGDSKVRNLYLPNLHPLDAGAISIKGRYRLTVERELELPSELVDGLTNCFIPKRSGLILLSAWRTPWRPNCAEEDRPDYIEWSYVADRVDFPLHVADLNATALLGFVLTRIRKWDAYIQFLIGDSELDTIACVPLRCVPALPTWDSSSVTLMGDAIHNVCTMLDTGANMALYDATNLARSLSEAAEGRCRITDAIAGYERLMRGYANKAIGISRRNIRYASMTSRLNRFCLRTALQAAEAIPGLKEALSVHHKSLP